MSPDMQQYEEPGAKPRWLGQLRAKQERLTRLETEKLPGIRCICERFVYYDGSCGNCDDDGEELWLGCDPLDVEDDG